MMVGMTAIDAWKVSILQENNNLTIKEYSDILAADMIDAAKNGGDHSIDVIAEMRGSTVPHLLCHQWRPQQVIPIQNLFSKTGSKLDTYDVAVFIS